MKIFERFRKKKELKKYAEMLNGYTPMFSQFGNDIYASDVVQQAVGCLVTEMKKVNVVHTVGNTSNTAPVNDNLQKVLNEPNPIMTSSDMMEKIMWNLLLNYNSFIVPIWETKTDRNGVQHREYTALYPIQPRNVTFLDSGADLWIRFEFANGYVFEMPYNDVIHVKKNFSVNDYMGGNEYGQPDNRALLKILRLNDELLRGIAKALRISTNINGIIKYNTLLDKNKSMENEIKSFEKKILENQSGILPMDLGAEFTQLSRNIQVIDNDILEFIDSKILRHFGVPLAILTGDYTKEQYEAFYQKSLEPIIISLSQAFTKTLFTPREKAIGHKIRFLEKELIFMTTAQKIELIRLLGDAGDIYENEKRIAFGLAPLEELEGVRMQSLNYVNAEYAKSYQLETESEGEENE